MPDNQPSDAADIIARMRQAAAERPDFVHQNPAEPQWAHDEGCVYFAGGDTSCPSCLVGIGIAPILGPDDFVDAEVRLGDDRDEPVQVHRFHNEGQDADYVLTELVDARRLFITRRQKDWIKTVQERQDTKTESWAAAVAYADRHYPLPDSPQPPQAESAGV